MNHPTGSTAHTTDHQPALGSAWKAGLPADGGARPVALLFPRKVKGTGAMA